MLSHMCPRIAAWRQRVSPSCSRAPVVHSVTAELQISNHLCLVLSYSLVNGFDSGPWLQESPLPHSRSPTRLRRIKKPTAPRLQVNTLPSHRPLSWHTERECFPTPDAILLFLELGQSQQRFTSCFFLFVCGPPIPPRPPTRRRHHHHHHRIKPRPLVINQPQTKQTWNKQNILEINLNFCLQRHFFPQQARNFFLLVKTSVWLYFKSTDYTLNTLSLVPEVCNILFTVSKRRR